MNAHAQVEELLQQMAALAPKNPRAAKLSEQISVLCRAYMEPTLNTEWLEKYKLTAQEARMVEFLAARMDKACSKGAILDAITFDHVDEPEIKIIDVLCCRLRRKLQGSPYVIETVWGQGYRMKRIDHESAIAHAEKTMAA